jgi:cellulose biosynthesis protein BcsQ
MSKLVVVLADTDERYLMPLELKFIEEFEDKADIVVITDKEYLKHYFSTPQKVDILIINEDLYSYDLEKHNIGNTFILLESDNSGGTQDMSINKIYKYTSVKEIYTEVINNTASKSLKPMNGNQDTVVIMVYSPCGGIGKTLISMGIGGALAKCYKRTLYVSTETLQSFNFLLSNKSFAANGFERQLTMHSEHIVDYLQSAIGNEMFDYILPFRQATSSYNIRMEDYRYLIEKVKASGRYDYIVVDTSTDFTAEKTMLMSFCDRVIVLTAQDEVSVTKLEFLLNNIDCSDSNKFLFICNKYNGEKNNCLIKDSLINRCSIGEYIENFDFNGENFNINFLAGNKHFQKLAYMFI